jgi:hypothetical protein
VSEELGYEVADPEEYCLEMCYHEHLCDKDPDCIDWDCYVECTAEDS